jgi:ribonuclease P/MRP protein subunit POP5
MKLLPSLKQKKRYVVFEIESSKKFSYSDLKSLIEIALKDFLGQLGLSKSSSMLVKEKFKDNKFIIKTNHTYVDECKAALILIKKIKNESVIVKSLTVSGTLKKAAKSL